ncbi:MAG: hypothetical protein KF862_00735 [Chitinophagaceae bacterium]|nr:hypothetical protein [Chitinophagaceae bacterium]
MNSSGYISTYLKDEDLIRLSDTALAGVFDRELRKQRTYLVTGGSAIGKTTLLVMLASYMGFKSPEKYKTGVITLGLSPQEWINRIIANLGPAKLEELVKHTNRLMTEREPATDKIYKKIAGDLLINENSYISAPTVLLIIKKWMKEYKPDVIVIDAVDRVKPDVQNKYRWLKALQAAAQVYNVPIVFSLPMKRAFSKKAHFRRLEKLKSVTRYADIIISIYKPSFYKCCKGETLFFVQENGQKPGKIKLVSEYQHQRYRMIE